MTITNVTIIGGSGLLGTAVIKALSAAGSFNITAIKRSSSKATFSVHSVTINDDLPEPDLITALTGQHALVITLPGTKPDESIRLTDAACKAGLHRIILGDFGSGDSADVHAQQIFAGYAAKAKVRAHVQSLATTTPGLSWTSILNGHFFDRNLRNGMLHFDLAKRSADIFDGGEMRWSTSTFERIAEAVVRVLHLEEPTRNRMVYVQSFCVSQRDVLGALERATGEAWKVRWLQSEEYLAGNREALQRGDQAALEDVVLIHGMKHSNWEKNPNFANGLLGLEDEDLDRVVKGIVDSFNGEK